MLFYLSMNLKQRNFYNILELYKLFNDNSKNICLIVHISNLNVLESNILKIYCDKNGIQSKYFKINLIKKLTKNLLFVNLFNGPTRIFFFQNVEKFLEFQTNFPLRKKITPLSVVFDNKIYSYLFFFNYLKSINNGQLLVSNVQFLTNITRNNQNLLITLKNPLITFISSLPLYNISNKIV